jgi:transcriptional regulator with XRE-family HTH domain
VKRVQVLAELGNRILLARQQLGLTQEDLADRAGISVTFCGQIERGRRNPTFVVVYRIATALETTVAGLCEDMAEGSDPKPGSHATPRKR